MNEIENYKKNNLLLFYLILGGLVAIHLFYVLYFYQIGSIFMCVFNVFSTLFYATLFIVFLRKRSLQVLNVPVFEICVHAFFAGITVGANSGFELFLVCTVFASLHLINITHLSKAMSYFFICFSFVLLLSMRFLPDIVDLSFFRADPSKNELDLLFIFNAIVAFVMVSFIMGIYISAVKTDQEKLKLLNRRLSDLASHDSLTQLLNRRAMKLRLEAAMHSKKKSNAEFVTAIADVDNFKGINDRYGHDCGDRVLKKVVQIIRGNVREKDYISRWGGDEILILFNNSSMEGALSCINRIHREIADSFFIYNNESIELTITIGVCPSGQYSSYQDIILEADRRLYDGKHRGKNCIVYDAPLTT